MKDYNYTYEELKLYFENSDFDKKEITTMIHNKSLYDMCFQLATTNDNPAAWRCAWALAACQEKYHKQNNNYLPDVINILPAINRDGHIRELLKLFRNLRYEEFPENKTGFLFDFCMKTFQDAGKKAGTRSIALQILLIFARKEPELLKEIRIAFEHIKPQLSNGIRKSCEHKITKLQNEYEY